MPTWYLWSVFLRMATDEAGLACAEPSVRCKSVYTGTSEFTLHTLLGFVKNPSMESVTLYGDVLFVPQELKLA